jgi:GNAT superfamily N-acetyltransferase
MTYHITFVDQVPDQAELGTLLVEYYRVVFRKLLDVGGRPAKGPEDMVESFWPSLHKSLPPNGRLVLARDHKDRLVGCGMMQQARADAGELKRLFVRPEASGHGLGRALVDARMTAARDMGWRTLLVNTVKGNQDMLRIYEKIGFRFIDRYPECADPIELDDYFQYMQFDFPEAG